MNSDEQHWAAWKRLMSSLPPRTCGVLRNQVANRVEEDRELNGQEPLQELGSSDINCYAVEYLSRGRLVESTNAQGWEWHDDK